MNKPICLGLIVVLATALLVLCAPSHSELREPFIGLGGDSKQASSGSSQAPSTGSDQASSTPASDGAIQWTNPWADLCAGQDAGWDTKEYGDPKVTLQTCIKDPGTDGCDTFQVVVGDNNKIAVQDCPKGDCPDSTPDKPGCTPLELGRDRCEDPRTALVFTNCANKQSWDENLAGPVGKIKAIADDQAMRDMLLKANQAQAMTLRQMMMVEVPQSTNGYEVAMGMMGEALSSSGQVTSLLNSPGSPSAATNGDQQKPDAAKPAKSGGLF